VAIPKVGASFGPGGVRIGLGGGDFSPHKLMGAVIGGEGFANPRMMGAIMVGLSMALGFANIVLIFLLRWYFPYLFGIGAIFFWCGAWMAVTGQPKAQADGSKAPMWGRLGLGAGFVFGVLVGLGLIAATRFGLFPTLF
jgi:hypothetical protein